MKSVRKVAKFFISEGISYCILQTLLKIFASWHSGINILRTQIASWSHNGGFKDLNDAKFPALLLIKNFPAFSFFFFSLFFFLFLFLLRRMLIHSALNFIVYTYLLGNSSFSCGPGYMHCSNNRCVSIHKRCDGVDHCGNNADEEKCREFHTSAHAHTCLCLACKSDRKCQLAPISETWPFICTLLYQSLRHSRTFYN